MTNALNKPDSTMLSTLDAKQIKEYLEQHPNFLIENPSILTKINLNHSPGKNTTSLAQRQVNTLRKKNDDLQNKLSTLIETAKKNEQLFIKTRQLISKISALRSKNAILELLNTQMTQYFNVDQCNVLLFSEHFDNTINTQRVSKTNSAQVLNSIIENQQKICGQLRDEERHFLFSSDTNNIKSAAIIPLVHKTDMLGIISLGSFQTDYFQTGSQTDLIDFLTEIISERLSSLDT